MRTTGKLAAVLLAAGAATAQDLAVRGEIVHTMAGSSIRDGVVLIRNGKIAAVGPASSTTIPAGMTVLAATVSARRALPRAA